MKNLCLPILILILFMTSCSKKKKTLKNIAGQWNMTSSTLHLSGGGSTDLLGQNNIIMDFQNCEYESACNVYTHTTISSTSTTYGDTSSYVVSESSGICANCSPNFIITINDTTQFWITTLTRSTMTLNNQNTDLSSIGEDITIITLEKL